MQKQSRDEGEVLLKNNGVLPLEKGDSISVFGYRYLSPVYGGSGSGNVSTDKDYFVEALANYYNSFHVR